MVRDKLLTQKLLKIASQKILQIRK